MNKLLLKKWLAILLIAVSVAAFLVYFIQIDTELSRCNNHKRKVFYHPHPSTIPLEHLASLDILDSTKLMLGKEEMAKHKLIVTGIARDNALDLPVVIKHIENLGNYFQDYRVVIFENDSKDGTKAIFEHWQVNNPKVKIISQDFYNEKRPSYKFMADVRNKYIEAINADPAYKDFDMVMIMDMDASYGFDVRGIQDSFAKIKQWEAVCSNGISTSDGKMFDMYAFRNQEFPNGPSDGYIKYWVLDVAKGQKIYDINADLVKVDSCFGGMAFYKKEYIKDCSYDSINEDCEHIVFHQCIKNQNNGRMFMNPAQVLRYSHFK